MPHVHTQISKRNEDRKLQKEKNHGMPKKIGERGGKTHILPRNNLSKKKKKKKKKKKISLFLSWLRFVPSSSPLPLIPVYPLLQRKKYSDMIISRDLYTIVELRLNLTQTFRAEESDEEFFEKKKNPEKKIFSSEEFFIGKN